MVQDIACFYLLFKAVIHIMHRQFAAAHVLSAPDAPDRSADAALLRALRSGQAAAWQAFLNQWSPRLYTYTLYNTHSETDAQQLLQSVFSLVTRTILQSNHKFDLTTLLVAALYRAVVDYQDRQGLPPLSAASPAQYPTTAQVQFFQSMNKLAPSIRHVLLLRHIIGLSLHELAAITGHSLGTLRTMLQRATGDFESLFG